MVHTVESLFQVNKSGSKCFMFTLEIGKDRIKLLVKPELIEKKFKRNLKGES